MIPMLEAGPTTKQGLQEACICFMTTRNDSEQVFYP